MTLSLHHPHLLATNIEATIEFWTRAFDATVVYDESFAGPATSSSPSAMGVSTSTTSPPKSSARGPSTTSESRPTTSRTS